ncbi:unnamed protein product [Paramecium pentaurelia]|uniref:WD domain, G-beta repeat protein n=1 Tax=Paramecium pentaurelia TaxID=43138 RepID=A0A8S1S6E0_9CILI|nr:unnamed protein product [Paramecium pentaurelia]
MIIRCTQADHLNQQIIGVCIDGICQYQRPYCNFCLPNHGQHLNNLTSLELLEGWINKRVLIAHNIQQKAQECKLAIDSLLNKFINILNINIVQLSTFGLSQIDNIIKSLCLIESCEKTLTNQLQQSIDQINLIVKVNLEGKKKQTNSSSSDNLLIQKNFEIKELIFEKQKHLNIQKQKLQPFTFEILNQNTIRQGQYCFAIAINKDNSIVLAGCDKNIKVFEFKQGKLNQIQVLSEHQLNVLTLNFMKKSNNFISASEDKQIIIWQINQNNQWIIQQRLNGHSGQINSLLLKNDEDVIISGSSDLSIKFWNKSNGWLCQQTIKNHTESIYQLSLNQMQNKLISCSRDSQIIVMEYSQKDCIWSVMQTIKVYQYGYRLCFINDNQFTFQPIYQEQMHVFEMNSCNKQFFKTKEITVKSGSNSCDYLFPQQYIKSKCLLVNKNGQNINLIRKKENGDFMIEQTIQFGHHYIFGQLSENGEYLITWDSKSKEIQIRKYKEL